MKLAYRLQRDYSLIDGDVIYKHKAIIKDKDSKDFEVPTDWFWVLVNKSKDGETIINASNILTHKGCLNLAEVCGIDCSKIKTMWVSSPSETNGHRAIVECTYPNLTPVIGEASPDSLNRNMVSYIATMALKRGIDRIITHATGVYQYGFYSQSELGGSFVPDDEVDERTALLDKVRELVKEQDISSEALRKVLADSNKLKIGTISIASASEQQLKNVIEALSNKVKKAEFNI